MPNPKGFSMSYDDVILGRRSIRGYKPDPVPRALIEEIIALAMRSPSSMNTQPWNFYIITGEPLDRIRAGNTERNLAGVPQSREFRFGAEFTGQHRDRQVAVAKQLFGAIGIARDDKQGRFQQFARNGDFFGAPAALFCFVDRQMGLPQWSDLGMFLQTFMLLAVERGLATCAQEYWSVRHGAIASFVGAPENEMLFCGMSIGYADPVAPVNGLRSERMPLDQWARFV